MTSSCELVAAELGSRPSTVFAPARSGCVGIDAADEDLVLLAGFGLAVRDQHDRRD